MKHKQMPSSRLPRDARRNSTTVLLHEFRRASVALVEFQLLASRLLENSGDRPLAIAVYDAYARFIHHLFEFYATCLYTDVREQSGGLHKRLLSETSRLMKNRADRIARGGGQDWDNTEPYYRENVPEEFASDFVAVRNQVAHALAKRARKRTSLPEFYERYHRFVVLLYEEAYGLWHAADDETIDWGEIGRFSEALRAGSTTQR